MPLGVGGDRVLEEGFLIKTGSFPQALARYEWPHVELDIVADHGWRSL